MAKLKNELTASVMLGDEKVLLSFRAPTNEELNDFMAKRHEVSAGKRNIKVRDNSLVARAEFFDKLLTKVENLEDSEGKPITPERKELIPSTWKNDIVFRLFEDTEIDTKN